MNAIVFFFFFFFFFFLFFVLISIPRGARNVHGHSYVHFALLTGVCVVGAAFFNVGGWALIWLKI